MRFFLNPSPHFMLNEKLPKKLPSLGRLCHNKRIERKCHAELGSASESVPML